MKYKKYRIQQTDRFNPEDFPKVIAELEVLNQGLKKTRAENKKEILIAYFKKSLLDGYLPEANSELIYMITNGAFATVHLKALFESSGENEYFQQDYENYLRENIS